MRDYEAQRLKTLVEKIKSNGNVIKTVKKNHEFATVVSYELRIFKWCFLTDQTIE